MPFIKQLPPLPFHPSGVPDSNTTITGLCSVYTMAAENFDGYAHVDRLMRKAINEDTTREEIKEAYVAWSKTYEQVITLHSKYFFYAHSRVK